jgi:hypothetical protein
MCRRAHSPLPGSAPGLLQETMAVTLGRAVIGARKGPERSQAAPNNGPSPALGDPGRPSTPSPVRPEEVRRIVRWDLDKTYLRTDFASFGKLLRTALQRAEQKVSFPGAPMLMRELRAQGGWISIISGSPRQMRKVLEQKLRLDGVDWDEFILKPSLSNLMRGRFRALRDQIGYKLPALLASRNASGKVLPEMLFGDDAEADAFIYSLYGDLLAGRIGGERLAEILEAADLYEDQRRAIADQLTTLAPADSVQRIFIHLERHSPPARFAPYGRRVVPIYNYFQASLVALADGVLPASSVLKVAIDMVTHAGYGPAALAHSFQDLLRRGYAEVGALTGLADAAQQYGNLFDVFRPARDIFEAFVRRLSAVAEHRAVAPPVAPEIAYLELLSDTRRV